MPKRKKPKRDPLLRRSLLNAEKPDHRYSGPGSAWFWDRVGALVGPDGDTVYSLGCVLQNLEESVLNALHTAEATRRK